LTGQDENCEQKGAKAHWTLLDTPKGRGLQNEP
jgi:hypothetical protein